MLPIATVAWTNDRSYLKYPRHGDVSSQLGGGRSTTACPGRVQDIIESSDGKHMCDPWGLKPPLILPAT